VFNWDDKRKSKVGISRFLRLNAGTALQALAVVTVVLFATTNAHADYLSLLTAGATGTINGASYVQGETGAAGTGVFPSFVRVQANGTEQGYNTPVSGVYDNTSDATHNLNINVSDLAVVTSVGVCALGCYEFHLDVNEAGGNAPASNQFISLDELQILTGPTASPTAEPATFAGTPSSIPGATLRYTIDGTVANGGVAPPNNGVLLDFQLEAGSGKADLTLFVPISFFGSAAQTDFVYLYSKFGLLGEGTPTCGGVACALGEAGAGSDFGTSDGFEEWSFRAGPGSPLVPEPSTYALYALGAAMLFVSGWWQKRRTAYNSSF
jgi:hypothetical protein